MQTNPAVEQNKTLNGPLVREISPVGRSTATAVSPQRDLGHGTVFPLNYGVQHANVG